MKNARDFKKISKNHLHGNWGIAICFALVFQVITFVLNRIISMIEFAFGIGDVSKLSSFLSILQYRSISDIGVGALRFLFSLVVPCITSALLLGSNLFYIRILRSEEIHFNTLFERFHIFGKSFLLRLVIAVFIFLWSLLFFVPGVVAYYRYSLASYLMADDPDISVMEAINCSKKMMRNNKGRLFCLDFSFIGWILLSLAAFCIGYMIPSFIFAESNPTYNLIFGSVFFGSIYLSVAPYINAARAAFYIEINANSCHQETH